MRLKRLSVHGYKTFATKTDFVFTEGITAIVGPNGSGKSNVADAVRWVLGEQSFSTLRGKRTEDMIFAGSRQRPRAGMVQANLTLDNSEGWLPIDFTEVEIGRRAYRSGDNEYLINGQKVRLRDVNELLASSGLSERTYTIIGQGLVDQALSLKADERRMLFEEAAGISHYKSQRALSLRRLEETQHNLERVNDILSELRPRLRLLRRQAKRTQDYDQVAADLRYHLRLWYGHQWEKAKEEARITAVMVREATEARAKGREELENVQSRIERQREQLNALQGNIEQIETHKERLRVEYEKARRELAVRQERKELLSRQLKELQVESPRYVHQRHQAIELLEEATIVLEQAQRNLQHDNERLLQFENSVSGIERDIRQKKQRQSQLDTQITDTARLIAQLEGQESQLSERVRDKKAQLGSQEGDDELLRKERLTRQELDKLDRELDKVRQRRTLLAQHMTTMVVESRKLAESIEETNNRLQALRVTSAELGSQITLLGQLTARKYAPASSAEKVLGSFAELVTLPRNYQRAIDAALADRTHTLLLADEDSLWSSLNSREAGESIIAAAANQIRSESNSAAPEDPAVIGWASEFARYSKEYEELANLLLGKILVVRDDRSAFRLARDVGDGCTVVSLDGLVVHAGGLVEKDRQNADPGLLARRTELEDRRRELQDIETEIKLLDEDIARQKASRSKTDEQLDQLKVEENEVSSLESELEIKRTAILRDVAEFDRRKEHLERDRNKTLQEISDLEKRLEKNAADVDQHTAALAEFETEREQISKQLEELPIVEIDNQKQMIQQQRESAQTIVAGRQAVVDSRRSTLDQIDDLISKNEQQVEQIKVQLRTLNLDEIQLEIDAHRQKLDELDGSAQPNRETLQEGRTEQIRLEKWLTALQRQNQELESRQTESRIRQNQAENRLDSLREKIQNDLGLVSLSYDDDQPGQTPLPMSDVVDTLPEVVTLPADIEETIQRYRGQLHRIGAINPEAPFEYEETQNRVDFLTQQVDDLTVTRQKLRKVIADLDALTSKKFAETVEKVDTEFGQIFKRLFGGGSAQLILTDPDDVNISGVDIVARLPARREQGLGLLSGGERSLTAAALVFALLKVSPTPFCILDEVDAMLDEANVTRFRELLQELAQNTQFIVITHNRGTVQAAETVYGISMGADSASQVISIKPEEYLHR